MGNFLSKACLFLVVVALLHIVPSEFVAILDKFFLGVLVLFGCILYYFIDEMS